MSRFKKETLGRIEKLREGHLEGCQFLPIDDKTCLVFCEEGCPLHREAVAAGVVFFESHYVPEE